MKKIFNFLSLVLILCFIAGLFVSCSSVEVKEKSEAGAYILMFDELIKTGTVSPTKYKYLSFDTESCGLEGETLDILRKHIKKYCEKNNVSYLEHDRVGLRRAFKISNDIYGEVFTEGYLLSFTTLTTDTNEGKEFYSADINFWHGEMDGIGAVDFFIIRTDDGWYIDREAPGNGYSLFYQ